MGFFTPGYLKEGKGVSKEQAEKRSYLGTLIDKFFDMIKVNLLYVACNIPALIICVLVAIPLGSIENVRHLLSQIYMGNVVIIFWFLLPFAPLILSGPFTAGLTYITRNFVKREHSFLLSDYLEHTKKNIKQTLLANALFFIVFYIYVSVTIYYITNVGNMILLAILMFLGAVLMSVPFYVYPMIVSFDMKLRDILKNAWIFALAKLPQNIVFLALTIVVHALLIFYIPAVWILLMLFILPAWTSYTLNHYAWNVIKKHMMPEEGDEPSAVFSDEIKKAQ